jgi:hypothetical protein
MGSSNITDDIETSCVHIICMDIMQQKCIQLWVGAIIRWLFLDSDNMDSGVQNSDPLMRDA